MSKNIYLDHNAASLVDPRVIEAVCYFLSHHLGNPSSVHSFGRECRSVLTKSRDIIAKYLSVAPEEIIFTSGGTEGVNMVIRGIVEKKSFGHIITSGVEHSAVSDSIKDLEKSGIEVTVLPTGKFGAVMPDDVLKALRPDTKLIAIMAVNNETGVKSDIEGIATIARAAGVPFFLDAVALLGKEHFNIPEGVSAMSFSGQKIHAIQGVGFCFIRRGLKLIPQVTGGKQQYGRRGGTENLPGVVALSKAVELLSEELPNSIEKMKSQRDFFENTLQELLGDVYVNGDGPRVCNTSNLYFSGVGGESLLTALDLNGVAASHGAACDSGHLEPSRVLLNMGYSRERVLSSVRFSISRFTTDEEIDSAIEIIVKNVKRLRALNSHR